MVEVARDLWRASSLSFCSSKVTWRWLLRTTYRWLPTQWKKCFLMHRGNLPCFNLCPLPPVLSLDTTENSLAPLSLHHPFRYSYRWNPLLNLLFSRLNSRVSLSLSSNVKCSSPFIIFLTLHWTPFSMSKTGHSAPDVTSPVLSRGQPSGNSLLNAAEDTVSSLCRRLFFSISFSCADFPLEFSGLRVFEWEEPRVDASLADFIFFLSTSHVSFLVLLIEGVLALGSETGKVWCAILFREDCLVYTA